MSYKILLPLDGSTESESALHYVRMLSGKTEVSLELLRCFEPPSTSYVLPDLERLSSEALAEVSLQERLLEYLERKRTEIGNPSCEISVSCGHPAVEIVNRARAADLVVMARRGGSGIARWLLGGVATKVVRGSTAPVLVVPSQVEQPRLETIMVCVDGSLPAEKALGRSVELARAVGAKLILYRYVPLIYAVGDPEADVEEARTYLRRLEQAHPDLVSRSIVRQSDGRSLIVETAAEQGVDLIAMGSAGLHGVALWILGSVAEDALHHASCPIMIVH